MFLLVNPPIWPVANKIRIWLNYLAPISTLALTIFLNLLQMFTPFQKTIWNTGLFDLIGLDEIWIFAFLNPYFFIPYYIYMSFVPQVNWWFLGLLIVGVLSGILYFVFVFKGVRDDTLYVWPQHVMMILSFFLASWGNWIAGLIMSQQLVFVSILGDDPIWKTSRSRKKANKVVEERAF